MMSICKLDFSQPELVGFKRVIDRGTAIILEESENGIFLYDTVSEAAMIVCEEFDKAVTWLSNHEKDELINDGKGYSLINNCGRELANYIKEKYQFESMLDCVQVVYTKDKCIISEEEIKGFEFCLADKEDVDLIYSVYQKISKEELETVIGRNKLFLGKKDGRIVGFIGEHLEGSMGLLNILPEFRRNGYGCLLEKMMINYTIDEGNIPFGQIETYNNKSMALQKKLGLDMSEEYVYWIF